MRITNFNINQKRKERVPRHPLKLFSQTYSPQQLLWVNLRHNGADALDQLFATGVASPSQETERIFRIPAEAFGDDIRNRGRGEPALLRLEDALRRITAQGRRGAKRFCAVGLNQHDDREVKVLTSSSVEDSVLDAEAEVIRMRPPRPERSRTSAFIYVYNSEGLTVLPRRNVKTLHVALQTEVCEHRLQCLSLDLAL